MRTITKNIYTFDELTERAKEKARNWYRENDIDFSDEKKSLKAIGNIVGKAIYEIDAWNHIHVGFYISDEAAKSLVNVRLLKYIYNNWIEPNEKWKTYWNRYTNRCSKITKEWDCPLTGFYMDNILMEAYLKMREGIAKGEKWNLSDFIDELTTEIEKTWEAEIDYRASDKYIDRELETNGYEFYEDGTAF